MIFLCIVILRFLIIFYVIFSLHMRVSDTIFFHCEFICDLSQHIYPCYYEDSFFLFREKKFFDGDLKALHTRMRSNRGMAKFHCSQLNTKKFLINSQLRKNISLASLMSLILRVMLRDAVLYVPSVKNITQIHALRETHDSARLAVSQTLEFTSGIFSQATLMPLHSSSSSFDRFIYRVDT